jgi:hypothetical protein
MPQLPEIRTEFLFAAKFIVDKPQILDNTPFGLRRFIAGISSGTFEGPKLRGKVQGTGGDWILVRNDGAWQMDVRLTLVTDDDHMIYMTYRGVRHGDPAVLDRLARGEPVDPGEYYFRNAPFFETGSDKYGWLNRIVTVGTGHRYPDGPLYEFYQVL